MGSGRGKPLRGLMRINGVTGQKRFAGQKAVSLGIEVKSLSS